MLTLPYLRYWHTRFNRLVFDGKLQRVPIVLTADMPDDWLGRCWGTSIDIRPTLDRTEGRRVLLHEMIHQWQCESKLPMDHGRSFNQWRVPCELLTGLSP